MLRNVKLVSEAEHHLAGLSQGPFSRLSAGACNPTRANADGAAHGALVGAEEASLDYGTALGILAKTRSPRRYVAVIGNSAAGPAGTVNDVGVFASLVRALSARRGSGGHRLRAGLGSGSGGQLLASPFSILNFLDGIDSLGSPRLDRVPPSHAALGNIRNRSHGGRTTRCRGDGNGAQMRIQQKYAAGSRDDVPNGRTPPASPSLFRGTERKQGSLGGE